MVSEARNSAPTARTPLPSRTCHALASWYRTYLVRKKKKGDAYTSAHTELYVNFRPEFYLLGFTQGTQISNLGLPQNMGWNDYNAGGAGTFDPLAE